MKVKEQKYIFSRSLGIDESGCEWLEKNIDTYKGMMKRKEMRLLIIYIKMKYIQVFIMWIILYIQCILYMVELVHVLVNIQNN